MGYLIVTCRSMLWMLVSIGIVVMHVFALITPEWLHRQDKSFLSALVSSTPSTATLNVTQSNGPDSIIFRQSSALGLLTRCSETYSVNPAAVLAADGVANITEDCEWIRNFSELPIWLWKVTVVFYCLGVVILALVGVVAVFSLCFKSICRKSLFTVCGLVQAIAGLIILLGLVMYPAGWGSEAVVELCGSDAAPFQFGSCSLGWSFFVAAAATVLTFACAVLSVQAEIATASDDVQDEILKGKYVICLP
ncbi:LHFPL tetraspan subfamily member 2 protein-like [Asterias amurensis]|uniref:LHFPL tetraspan subfamily member 2 protein-like n=1 Tax=Asterias amurensis TaxID=7602 RepID=UPI003AB41A8C